MNSKEALNIIRSRAKDILEYIGNDIYELLDEIDKDLIAVELLKKGMYLNTNDIALIGMEELTDNEARYLNEWLNKEE